MSTALTLLSVLACAAGWHTLTARLRRTYGAAAKTTILRAVGLRPRVVGLPANEQGDPLGGRAPARPTGRKRPGRLGALIAVVLVFGLETIVVAP
ncbi:MAG TPA: hypothetical protein VFG87_30340, partial [Amycolatopsis sp.]|nr:hypothetical protein [Amycolatopsis sp.]